jgi:predicted enzyme related to lactoylglutathione lyase
MDKIVFISQFYRQAFNWNLEQEIIFCCIQTIQNTELPAGCYRSARCGLQILTGRFSYPAV